MQTLRRRAGQEVEVLGESIEASIQSKLWGELYSARVYHLLQETVYTSRHLLCLGKILGAFF